MAVLDKQPVDTVSSQVSGLASRFQECMSAGVSTVETLHVFFVFYMFYIG